MKQSNNKKSRDVTAFLYERLSRDDNLEGESYSIGNQKKLLAKVAKEKGYTNLVHFLDDGISGVTMDRPGFVEMIRQLEQGKAAAVFVKDLSRLGRNYIEVGRLTEEFFPDHDIRLVAVSDNIDTAEGENELAPIRNLFKNISHSGKVSNDFSLFGRFCRINRCFRCSCGKLAIVHGVQAAIAFPAAAIGEKRDLPETHPVQPRTESKRPCRSTRAKPASKGLGRALSV
ncbi:MAG TPA: recombinase family protein [Clostridiales bacterium]|nr:recombinase family protein [Clostridiales bacterium]